MADNTAILSEPLDTIRYDESALVGGDSDLASNFGIGAISEFHPRYTSIFGYDIHDQSKYELYDQYKKVWTKALQGIMRGPLYLAEPISMSTRSNFDTPFSGLNLRALKFAADATQLLTGKPTHFDHIDSAGFRSWAGSEPLSINVNLKFCLGMWGLHDARTEVYNPLAFLSQLCLPAGTGSGGLIAPAPNSYAGYAYMVNTYAGIASSISSALFSENVLKFLDKAVQVGTEAAKTVANTLAAAMSAYRGVYNIQIGGMNFGGMVCESVELSFSQDVDTLGFPIWGTARMTFQSLFAAKAGDIPVVDVQTRKLDPDGNVQARTRTNAYTKTQAE